MGNTKSVQREEEVIIAQNGANNASNSHLEQKIEIYGIMLTAMAVMLIVLIFFVVYKACCVQSKKWFRSELNTWQSAMSLAGMGVNPLPSARNGHPTAAAHPGFANV